MKIPLCKGGFKGCPITALHSKGLAAIMIEKNNNLPSLGGRRLRGWGNNYLILLYFLP
jgi:hypothetical protein